MKKILFIVAMVLIPALAFAAQEEHEKDDFGIWSTLSVNFKISDKWRAGLLAEHRSKDMTRSFDCALVMPSVEYRPWKFFRCGFASEYVMCGDNTNQLTFRPYVTFLLNSGPLCVSLRELPVGEYTFETKTMTWTSRTRVKASYNIESIRLEPYVASEIFIRDGWQKSRHYVGTEFSFGKHSFVDIYYMYYIMSGKSYQRHVLGLGYGLNF